MSELPTTAEWRTAAVLLTGDEWDEYLAGWLAAAEARGYQKAIDALRKREHGSVIPDYRDEARRAADYLEGSR